MRFQLMLSAALALALATGGCGSQAQSADQSNAADPIENYVHRPTGFAFPATVGAFRRSDFTAYDRDGTDVGAGYDKVAGSKGIATTVFVYPAPRLTSIASPESVIDDARNHLCEQAWGNMKAEIIAAHPDARLLESGAMASPSPSYRSTGHRAVYLFTDNFAGVEQSLHSEADLFCYAGKEWLIAYRTTAPAAYDYRPDLERFMHALVWPATMGR